MKLHYLRSNNVTYDQCIPLLAIAALRDKVSVMKILNETQAKEQIYYSLIIITEIVVLNGLSFISEVKTAKYQLDVDLNKTKSLVLIYSFISKYSFVDVDKIENFILNDTLWHTNIWILLLIHISNNKKYTYFSL